MTSQSPPTESRLDEPLYDDIQLAQRWGCHPGRLRNDRSAGRGPAYVKLGRNVRYRLCDIIAFEVSCLREPGPRSAA